MGLYNPWAFPLVVLLIIVGTIWIVRYRSEEYREGMTEKERRSLIGRLTLLTIVAPLAAIALVIRLVAATKPFLAMPDELKTRWIFAVATVGSAAGLPFGVKLLRTIRSDANASATSLLLSGYGIVVWLIFFGMLLVISTTWKSCC